jgi:peptidoglycan hydrolase CwlO-like protein
MLRKDHELIVSDKDKLVADKDKQITELKENKNQLQEKIESKDSDILQLRATNSTIQGDIGKL